MLSKTHDRLFQVLLMQSTKLHSTKHKLSDIYKLLPSSIPRHLKRQLLPKLGFKCSWGKAAICFIGKLALQEVAVQTNRYRSGRIIIYVHTNTQLGGVTT